MGISTHEYHFGIAVSHMHVITLKVLPRKSLKQSGVCDHINQKARRAAMLKRPRENIAESIHFVLSSEIASSQEAILE